MMYIHPDAGSLQQWADMVDNKSYIFDSTFSYFQKSCHSTPPDVTSWNPRPAPQYNTKTVSPDGGPLQVSFYNNV